MPPVIVNHNPWSIKVGGLFKQKTPKPPKAVLMPDPEDPEVKDASRLEYLAARKRSGRASTMLGGNDDSYSGNSTGMK